MTDTRKETKRDVLNYMLETYASDEKVVAYATHEIELLDKKNANKGSNKTQKENAEIKEMLLQVLTSIARPVTITELLQNEQLANYIVKSSELPLSNQKVSALFTQMVKEGTIVRTTDKKKSYFSVA